MEKEGEGQAGKGAVRGIRMGQSGQQMIVTELGREFMSLLSGVNSCLTCLNHNSGVSSCLSCLTQSSGVSSCLSCLTQGSGVSSWLTCLTQSSGVSACLTCFIHSYHLSHPKL